MTHEPPVHPERQARSPSGGCTLRRKPVWEASAGSAFLPPERAVTQAAGGRERGLRAGRARARPPPGPALAARPRPARGGRSPPGAALTGPLRFRSRARAPLRAVKPPGAAPGLRARSAPAARPGVFHAARRAGVPVLAPAAAGCGDRAYPRRRPEVPAAPRRPARPPAPRRGRAARRPSARLTLAGRTRSPRTRSRPERGPAARRRPPRAGTDLLLAEAAPPGAGGGRAPLPGGSGRGRVGPRRPAGTPPLTVRPAPRARAG